MLEFVYITILAALQKQKLKYQQLGAAVFHYSTKTCLLVDQIKFMKTRSKSRS